MIGTSKVLLALAGGLLIGGMAPLAPAAGARVTGSGGERGVSQQPATITGCVAKGTAKDTFTITGKDKKTYMLTSPTVSLAPHVGHTVTVQGTLAGAKPAAQKETTAVASGVLSVAKLTMVSTKCQ